jgi:hypothetical protein
MLHAYAHTTRHTSLTDHTTNVCVRLGQAGNLCAQGNVPGTNTNATHATIAAALQLLLPMKGLYTPELWQCAAHPSAEQLCKVQTL